MSTIAPPAAEQLQALLDREEIRALVSSFARSIDTKNQPQYAANFAEDGELTTPFGTRVGRAAIADMKGPPPGTHAHHLIGQVDIDLHGDTATATTYMIATHVFSSDSLTEKAHSGGWYEQEFVRTSEGWKFSKVSLVIRWEDERPMIPSNPSDVGGVAK